MPTNLRYPFGTDVAEGSAIPVPGGHPALEALNGLFGVTGGKPTTSTAISSSPILATRAGRGDFDITAVVNSNGGDAIYARVVDGSNWLRTRMRRYQVYVDTSYDEYEWTWQEGYTEHEWSGTWRLDANIDPIFTNPQSTTARNYWNTSTTTTAAPASSPSIAYQQDTDGNGTFETNKTGPYNYRTATSRTGSTRFVATANKALWGTSSTTAPSGAPTTATDTVTKAAYSGKSRRVSSGYYDTRYQVVLERSVAGVVSTIATAGSTATSLRFRGVGTSLEVFINGATGANISHTDTHATTSTWTNVNRHGIGRGPSDLSGTTGLDEFTLSTVNDAPRPPALGTVPPLKGGGTLTWTPDDPEGDPQAGWRLYRSRTSTPNVVEYWNSSTQSWVTTPHTNTGTATSASFPRGAWRKGAYDVKLETTDAKGPGIPKDWRVFIPGGMAMVM